MLIDHFVLHMDHGFSEHFVLDHLGFFLIPEVLVAHQEVSDDLPSFFLASFLQSSFYILSACQCFLEHTHFRHISRIELLADPIDLRFFDVQSLVQLRSVLRQRLKLNAFFRYSLQILFAMQLLLEISEPVDRVVLRLQFSLQLENLLVLSGLELGVGLLSVFDLAE